MSRRERIFVTADQWQRRLTQLDKMQAAERREFDEKYRYEISLTEDRIQALAIIRQRFGSSEGGWERCAAQGGCSISTYRSWDDPVRNVQPRDQSFKKTAVACGVKYGFHDY